MPIPATFNRMTRTIRHQAAQMTRTQKMSAAGVAVVGASVLAVSVVPGSVQAAANPSHAVVGNAQVVGTSHPGASPTPTAPGAKAADASTTVHTTDVAQHIVLSSKHTKAHTAAKAAHLKKAEHHKKAHHKKAHHKRAHHKRAGHPVYKQVKTKAVAASTPEYANNLNGWIEHAMAIMKKHNIPGSYEGIKRNVLRESSGNPQAINLWDVNAQNGVPSKGLLQVIPPTFATYHVAGTSKNIYNPVSNIVAACNYAAHRYGSMDNVNSAY